MIAPSIIALVAIQLLSHGVKAADLPPGAVSRMTLKSPLSDPAAKIVKIKHGPYTVPANGMVNNAMTPKVALPCTDCYITAMQAGLEYADGTEANIDTGAWLHHMVLYNTGQKDAICARKSALKLWPQRIFSSGNERTLARLNANGNWGLPVLGTDTFGLLTELMNEAAEPKSLYLTMLYEYVPASTAGYKAATIIEMDATECGDSELPAKEGVYEYHSAEWVSPYSGEILWVIGHGHDGATDVNMLKNGKVACNSVQYYGLEPAFVAPGAGEMPSVDNVHQLNDSGHAHGGASTSMKHISNTAVCTNIGRLEKGDKLVVEGLYNSTKYAQMAGHGEHALEPQMAISFLYLGLDQGLSITPDTTTPVRMPVEIQGNIPTGFGCPGLPVYLIPNQLSAMMAFLGLGTGSACMQGGVNMPNLGSQIVSQT
ncbi:hypothetical protein P152DRAFT_479101 [Eremomyces bilateralis CBS 781.70]|uniref:Uncharacterized protein n=1 Tax=Eremomyces bilateralis CBS 781.70 TaxID=1392243 RepID=A0A6G1GET6_9PEZI|nr:uncharacterized protein P152DRAFT_479101 [Eremomyces bilateralis CBS 781.70]KAF1816587.1 hypothetical protein P152DRAFT_479101 [Eremomyces bilateralis CBS 781.70]